MNRRQLTARWERTTIRKKNTAAQTQTSTLIPMKSTTTASQRTPKRLEQQKPAAASQAGVPLALFSTRGRRRSDLSA